MNVYVSGPLTAKTSEETEYHTDNARLVAVELMRAGHTVICPHTMTIPMVKDLVEWKHSDWLTHDLGLLRMCDAVVVLPDFLNSVGTLLELKTAEEYEIPCYFVGREGHVWAIPIPSKKIGGYFNVGVVFINR